MRRIEKASLAATSRVGRLAFAATVAVLCLAAFASIASANLIHPFVRAFGPNGTSSSKFVQNMGIAIDPASHDIYVLESKGGEEGAGRVYRFTASGAPDNFTEGPGAGTNSLPKLSFPSPFKGASGVAVAPPGAAGGTAGDIYVTNWGTLTPFDRGRIYIFASSGALLSTIEVTANGNPHSHENSEGIDRVGSVTTDPAGNVYIGYSTVIFTSGDENVQNHVDKYVPTGNPLSPLDFDSEITGLVPGEISADSEYLYSNRRLTIGNGTTQRFDLSLFPGGKGTADVSGKGEAVPSEALFLSQDLSGHQIFGTARDSSSDSVYVSVWGAFGPPESSDNQIRLYGPAVSVEPPSAKVDPVSGVTFESAHFSGTVNAGGTGELQKTTYRFQCKPSCPGLEADREVPADGADHEVTDDAEGLEPGTKYEVSLIAGNPAGEAKDTAAFETAAKPTVEPPQATIDPVSAVTATSAHLSGTVDPGGSGENQATTYRFEYLNGLEWLPLADQGPIEGSGPQEVSAEFDGLEPNTIYSVRLRAENLGGVVFSPLPDPTFTTEAVAPVAEATSATHVKAASAQLNARIQPHKLATSYFFQWGSGDCDAGGCASVPASQDGDAGEGANFVFVKAQLEGLEPNTAYHYRLIAQSQAGKTTTATKGFTTPEAAPVCPNARLRNGAAAALPDCRAYELVSPLDKNGSDIAGNPRRTRVATDGNAVSYMSRGGFAGSEGLTANGAEYISRRGADGWSTYPITPRVDAPAIPSLFADSQYVSAFSADLSRAVFRGLAPVGEGIATPNVIGAANLYLGTDLGSPAPSMQLLSDSVNPLGFENSEFNTGYEPPIQFADASDDFSHILFESGRNLTADASGSEDKLYEWIEGQGTQLAGILPDSACGSPPCPAASSAAGAGAQSLPSGHYVGTFTQAANTISADGSRVFFRAGAKEDSGDLYLREAGTTVRIDASERSQPIPGNPGGSEFEAATPDGSVAFFLSTRSLTDDDVDPPPGGETPGGGKSDLYRYDVEAPAGHRLTLMTPEPEMPEALRINSVPGISEDGSYVYLEGNRPGEDGVHNRSLFLLHDGEARFIANKTDSLSWGEQLTNSLNEFRVSPDGRHVLIASDLDQGLYDNVGYNELYLYSADSDELACVSCNPSGAQAKGNVSLQKGIQAKGDSATQFLSRPMSSDGRYVFFNSSDALVPEDSNGKLDAYEYDTESGKLALVSSGQCNCESAFIGTSPSGGDAFFTTREQLVRVDTDDLYDLYDARVGGGIASQNQLPPVTCEGDACQPLSNPPAPQTPSSAGFKGPGSSPAKAKKQKAKHKRHRHTSKAKKHKRHVRANGKRG